MISHRAAVLLGYFYSSSFNHYIHIRRYIKENGFVEIQMGTAGHDRVGSWYSLDTVEGSLADNYIEQCKALVKSAIGEFTDLIDTGEYNPE